MDCQWIGFGIRVVSEKHNNLIRIEILVFHKLKKAVAFHTTLINIYIFIAMLDQCTLYFKLYTIYEPFNINAQLLRNGINHNLNIDANFAQKNKLYKGKKFFRKEIK